jgi:hypothetical protein
MSAAGNRPTWVGLAPSLFDIVATYFPEHTDPDNPGLKLRPGLVVKVLRGKTSGKIYCNIAYGTKQLKITKRGKVDLIIQNANHISQLGLARATRFDLDCVATELPWNEEFFGCWSGKSSPIVGALTENYIREYAYLMLRRGLAP